MQMPLHSPPSPNLRRMNQTASMHQAPPASLPQTSTQRERLRASWNRDLHRRRNSTKPLAITTPSGRPFCPITVVSTMPLQSSPIVAVAVTRLLLRELLVEECFASFKRRELARLPCSICGQHCQTYGIVLPRGKGLTRCCTVTKAGHDIYGLKIDNHDANGQLAECSICQKSVAASRFAPHLEKCMGMGRSARKKRSRFTPFKGVMGSTTQASPSSTSDYDDAIDAEGPSDDHSLPKSSPLSGPP